MRVNDSCANLRFLVIPDSRHEILLGMDWLRQTKPWLYPASKLISFENKKEQYILNSESTVVEEANTNVEQDNDYNEHCDYDHGDIDEEVSWEKAESIKIEPKAKLTKQQLWQFKRFTSKINKFIAKNFKELGKCSIIKHVIQTTDEIPIYIPPYRKSQAERAEIARQLLEMELAKIIRKSKSPWSSPLIMVRKPDKCWRLCIDFRQLNKKTVQQNFPIPRILDILDRLNGSVFFSTLDLKSGYWQVEMAEASIAKTAFSSQDGHYEFLRLPFGLKNAPEDFSRMMHMTLGDLDFVEIYLDDITIHSKSFEDHLKHISIY